MNSLFLKEAVCDITCLDEDHFIHDIECIRNLKSLKFPKNITFFVGENQSGKSTLLEAIAICYGLNKDGGTMNYNFSTFDDTSNLSDALTLFKGVRRAKLAYFFRAETFFNVASQSEEYRDEVEEYYYRYYGGKSFHKQSHGESFYNFITTYKENGLYFLDEPEAALSPQKQLSLLIYLKEMVEKGSQFVIATHSPILLGLADCEILSFDGSEIIPMKYQDTQAYQIYELFINHKDQLLKQLFNDEL